MAVFFSKFLLAANDGDNRTKGVMIFDGAMPVPEEKKRWTDMCYSNLTD